MEGEKFWYVFGNVWLIFLIPAFWVEIGMLHFFREPNGDWSDRYLNISLAIKNVLLAASAFCVVFLSATVLRPYIRELTGAFFKDVGGLFCVRCRASKNP